MILERLFKRPTKVKSIVDFTAEELNKAIKTNRNSLKIIDNWIDETAFKNSFFAYGVPDFIKAELNKEINGTETYSDYMLLIGNKHFKKVSYLEIGVSVGKNWFQMINGLHNAKFTGFDIEEINPVIEKKFVFKNVIEWASPSNSIKKNRSSLSRYEYDSKEVNYVSADVWDINSWEKLRGNKFNIVFSDALHTPEAILFEFEMLVKFNLLDERFVIVWDDLVGDMKNSFFEIIRKYNKAYTIKEVYLLEMNGWVGEHEGVHSVGIISNFAF